MRVNRQWGLVAVLMLASCGGSAYKRCRVGASFEQDPYLREMKLGRCEQIGNREYVENARQDEHRREAASGRARANQQQAAWYRAIRAAPRAPELGGTPAESAAICNAQGGSQSMQLAQNEPGVNYACRVEGIPIYAGHVLPTAATFDAITTFYENADIAAMRDTTQRRFGAADGMEIVSGFRLWRWEHTTPRVCLATYARGVSLTFRLTMPEQAGSGAGTDQPPVR